MLLLVQTEVFRVDSIINSINPSITATRVTTSSPSSTTRGGALSCEGEHLNMLTDWNICATVPAWVISRPINNGTEFWVDTWKYFRFSLTSRNNWVCVYGRMLLNVDMRFSSQYVVHIHGRVKMITGIFLYSSIIKKLCNVSLSPVEVTAHYFQTKWSLTFYRSANSMVISLQLQSNIFELGPKLSQ